MKEELFDVFFLNGFQWTALASTPANAAIGAMSKNIALNNFTFEPSGIQNRSVGRVYQRETGQVYQIELKIIEVK